jgi:peptidoglycan/xylan/chitin deacetylase (PgdA/CDA1 family)
MSKRESLIDALERIGLVELLLRTRSVLGLPWLTALTYHRVARPGASAELDEGVIDATPEQFDQQIGLLARHFRFVSVDEVADFLEQGKPLPNNPLLITFDDGYLDCVETALPLLEKHGARATFFLPTHYIDERRLFWWDKISLLLKRSTREQIELTYPSRRLLPLGPKRPASERRLLALVKTERGLDLPRFFDHLEAASGAVLTRDEERALVDASLMTWADAERLLRAGMDIGSHTRTHRVLQTLVGQDLDDEISGSRRELELRFDRKISSIAYPVGYPVADDPAIRGALERAGYAVGFTNSTGVSMTLRRPHPFGVRRLAMEVGLSHGFFRGLAALPHLASTRAA